MRVFFNSSPRICLLILEREEGGEREKYRFEKETSIGFFLSPPSAEMKPATPAFALTGIQTHNHFDGQDDAPTH